MSKSKTKTLDYSVWDHIEVSDDEDDTHPNIDTPSLFRWRHSARVERMEKETKEKEEVQSGHTSHQRKMLEIKQKIKEAESIQQAADKLANLKMELSEMEKQEDEWRQKEEELRKKEKLTPWNIDTLCHEGKSKTLINKDPPKKTELTDEEKLEQQEKFTKENKTLLKKFGMFKKYEDSQQFLTEHPQLAAEETANYLVLWCINLEVEEKHDLMEHVAHQTIVMQFILELAKTLKVDPRNCIRAFFSRIQLAEKQYLDAFNDELESFKARVRGRAQARIEAAMKEVEEEERAKRLGPGGLDPVEVYESLPEALRECFDKKDIPMLQEAMLKLSPEDAQYHMKRCVDSGLWVPGGGAGAGGSTDMEGNEGQEEEEEYSEAIEEVEK